MPTVVLNWGLSRQGCLGGDSGTLSDHPPAPVWEDRNVSPYSAQEIEERIGESEEWDPASHPADESPNLLHGVPRAHKRR
jgi:hypothetical protein